MGTRDKNLSGSDDTLDPQAATGTGINGDTRAKGRRATGATSRGSGINGDTR